LEIRDTADWKSVALRGRRRLSSMRARYGGRSGIESASPPPLVLDCHRPGGGMNSAFLRSPLRLAAKLRPSGVIHRTPPASFPCGGASPRVNQSVPGSCCLGDKLRTHRDLGKPFCPRVARRVDLCQSPLGRWFPFPHQLPAERQAPLNRTHSARFAPADALVRGPTRFIPRLSVAAPSRRKEERRIHPAAGSTVHGPAG